MRVPHRAGNATIGHNAADNQRVDLKGAQDILKPGLIEGGVRDLFDGEVGRGKGIDQRMPERARCEITLGQKRAQLFQMG